LVTTGVDRQLDIPPPPYRSADELFQNVQFVNTAADPELDIAPPFLPVAVLLENKQFVTMAGEP
jgi:hypothetical protein